MSITIIKTNQRVWRKACATLRPQREVRKLSCICTERGPVESVTDVDVEDDDDELPPSMQGKAFTYTGEACRHCGRRHSGTYLLKP